MRDPWSGYDAWKTTDRRREQQEAEFDAYERWRDENIRWKVEGEDELWEFNPVGEEHIGGKGGIITADEVTEVEPTMDEWAEAMRDAYDGPDEPDEPDICCEGYDGN